MTLLTCTIFITLLSSVYRLLSLLFTVTSSMNCKRKTYFEAKESDSKKSKSALPFEEIEVNSTEEIVNKKNTNTAFSNISHKKSFGANNWKRFLSLVSQPNVSIKTESKQTFQNKNWLPKSTKPQLQEHNASISVSGQLKCHKRKPISISVYSQCLDNKCRPSSKSQTLDLHKSGSEAGGLAPRKNISAEKPLVKKQIILTKEIAMDCEMVGVEIGVGQNNSMLGRVSLVNAHGDCVYDKFVKPTEPILDYRTRFSGIRPGDLDNATDFKIVQKEVADILKGRVLVGHALQNDLGVLFLTHPNHLVRDTSKFKKFREGRTPALKRLAKKYLGVAIQDGEHSSIQDALAAMQLYKMFRNEWERSFRPNNGFNQVLRNKSSSISGLWPVMDEEM